MENEKISGINVHEDISPDAKTMNEKTAETTIREHEPYDATALNVGLGEFPMHPTPRGPHDQNSLKEELIEEEVFDLYVPLPVDANTPVEQHILTARAVFVGCILGGLVNASNLYLGNAFNFVKIELCAKFLQA